METRSVPKIKVVANTPIFVSAIYLPSARSKRSRGFLRGLLGDAGGSLRQATTYLAARYFDTNHDIFLYSVPSCFAMLCKGNSVLHHALAMVTSHT